MKTVSEINSSVFHPFEFKRTDTHPTHAYAFVSSYTHILLHIKVGIYTKIIPTHYLLVRVITFKQGDGVALFIRAIGLFSYLDSSSKMELEIF